jgi:hypothetical protein
VVLVLAAAPFWRDTPRVATGTAAESAASIDPLAA